MNHTKLSPGDRRAILRVYAQGQTTQDALARQYNVHESTIRRVIHGTKPGERVPHWLHRRVSSEDMEKLRARIPDCSNYSALAREYTVSRTYISKIALSMGIKARPSMPVRKRKSKRAA